MNEKMEEVGPTEEVVQALLECMVEPLLGRNSFKSKEVPTLDQQRSMAKQVVHYSLPLSVHSFDMFSLLVFIQ